MKIFRIFLSILVVLLATHWSFGQTKQLSKVEDIPLKTDNFIGIDKFDNLYHVSNNTLFKVTGSGETIAFKDVLLGDIERIDILNPNKITVFYKMSNTVVILDNRMTEISRQDFNRLSPFKNVGFAGTSKDQGLWIYNIDLNQLELYDYRYNKTLANSLPIDEEILSMKNNFNFCFLETSEGFSIFNIYGSLVKKINVSDVKAFDLYKNKFIIHSGDNLILYDEDFEPLESFKLQTDLYKNFFYNNENLYLYDGKNISRYKIISQN
jgi:hypothetical protein